MTKNKLREKAAISQPSNRLMRMMGFFRIGMGLAISSYAVWHLFVLSRGLF